MKTYIDNNENNIEIDWDYYKNIPIEDVMQIILDDAYGMNTNKSKIYISVNENNRFRGKCLCPFHNDTNPSGNIIRDESYNYRKGQYGIKNFFYCPVDNICANPIDVVSKYYDCSIKDAILKYLAPSFPNGITYKNNEQQDIEEDDIDELPYIQPEILKEIGFNKDPFKFIKIKDIYKIPENKSEKYYKNINYEPEVLEVCDMLIERFINKIDEINNFNNEILNKYPKLQSEYSNALLYINDKKQEKIKQYTAYIGILRDYIKDYEEKYCQGNIDKSLPWERTLPQEPRTREYSDGKAKTDTYGRIEPERMTNEEKIFYKENIEEREE